MQPVRSLYALALAALMILGLVACSSGQAPGWTYAPPPSPSAAPSTAPSAAASTASSAAPSAAASSVASVEPSGPASIAPSAAASEGTGGTTVLNEVAQNVQFTTLSLTAPAGQPFQIAFDNQDASIMHNIEIKDAGGVTVFDGELITGVAQTTYDVNALPAGAYKFSCKVHPSMIGDLTVQ